MRLICPNCGAKYEVDASLIPEDGRDVQCSNCGQGWFQHPDGAAPEEIEEAQLVEADGDTAAPDAAASPRRQKKLDPAVADVLREEAQREAAARRAESEGLESQPDLGLDEAEDRAAAADRSTAARARMSRLRKLEADETRGTASPEGARSEVFPNVDEINSTLRGQHDRNDEAPEALEDDDEAPRRRRGFRAGFLLIVVLVVVAVAVYALAPQIGQWVPQAEPYLAGYVAAVNDLRLQVNGWTESAIGQIRGLISGDGE